MVHRNLTAFVSGALFGLGLMISGMTDTAKVIGWLDVFGDWDPTLAFVMGGAILPMVVAWRIASGMERSRSGRAIPARPTVGVERHLVIGSTLFGMGWGIAGLCPGPSMASLSYNGVSGLIFIAAMIAGMAVAPAARRRINQWAGD